MNENEFTNLMHNARILYFIVSCVIIVVIVTTILSLSDSDCHCHCLILIVIVIVIVIVMIHDACRVWKLEYLSTLRIPVPVTCTVTKQYYFKSADCVSIRMLRPERDWVTTVPFAAFTKKASSLPSRSSSVRGFF